MHSRHPFRWSSSVSPQHTQMNHIRQTDRQTHTYTKTAGTHPSYQGHITLNMQATGLLKLMSSIQRPGQGDCRVPWALAPHLAI